MPPQLDVGLDPALDGHQPQLLQPRCFPGERLHLAHIGKRRAPPQPQRLPEPVRRGGRLTSAEQRLTRPGQSLEADRIHQVRIGAEHIAAAARRQRGVRGQ